MMKRLWATRRRRFGLVVFGITMPGLVGAMIIGQTGPTLTGSLVSKVGVAYEVGLLCLVAMGIGGWLLIGICGVLRECYCWIRDGKVDLPD